jgi:hypothetical protein
MCSQSQDATYHVSEGLGCDRVDKVAAVNGLVRIPHSTLTEGKVRMCTFDTSTLRCYSASRLTADMCLKMMRNAKLILRQYTMLVHCSAPAQGAPLRAGAEPDLRASSA